MADFELNLTHEHACNDSKAAYTAQVFIRHGWRDTRAHRVPLAVKRPTVDRPAEIFGMIREKLSVMQRERIVAASIHRLCMKPLHDYAPKHVADGVRLERVAAFVLADERAELLEDILPPSMDDEGDRNIGSLRRKLAGTTDLYPVVYLPVTPAERKLYPVRGALELPQHNGTAMAYVAIRGLEQVITPSELQ